MLCLLRGSRQRLPPGGSWQRACSLTEGERASCGSNLLYQGRLLVVVTGLYSLLIGCSAASSFSLPRKKQRGPEGVSEFCPWTATPSGLPPSPHSSPCPESSSPHGLRGGGPRLPDTSAARCGFARFRDSAASAAGGFRGAGWDSDLGSLARESFPIDPDFNIRYNIWYESTGRLRPSFL